MPRGFSPGDARGGSPLHKKAKISPFPPGRGAGGGGMGAKDLFRVTDSGQPHRKPLSTSPHTPCCRKPTRFSTPCGKDCGLFPVFSQPVENRVENPGIQPRMHSPTDTDCPCFQQFPPNVVLSCGLWICIKTGQGIPPRNPTRTARTLHIPQWRNARISHRTTEKIRPQRPVCRTENAGFAPGYPQKTPSGEDFHNPPGRNPEVHHRNRQEEEPENPCRACIFRFSTVSRPLLLLLLDRRDKKTDRRTDRACARGKTDRKRRTTFPDASRRTEKRRRKNVAVPESPARTHIY